jgi:hypothetical protein
VAEWIILTFRITQRHQQPSDALVVYVAFSAPSFTRRRSSPRLVASRPGRTHEPNHQGRDRQTYFYETHHQLRAHLRDFVDAYNFARRLKTLRGFTPYEFVCKTWTSQPERFKVSPLQQTPGLNI